MAHADYDCCARCDSKMAYSGFDALTKEEVCSGCALDLFELTERRITTGKELIDYIVSYCDEEDVAALGISTCFYDNPVDAAVAVALPADIAADA